MDTSTLSHVAAILIGVVMTLVLAKVFSNGSATKSVAAPAPASKSASKKKKKKKAKKAASEEPAQAPAPAAAPSEKAKAPAPNTNGSKAATNGATNGASNGASNGGGGKKNNKKKKKAVAPLDVPAPKKTEEVKVAPPAPAAPASKAPVVDTWQAPPMQEEEWNDVVTTKSKKKTTRAKKPVVTPAPTAATIPTPLVADSTPATADQEAAAKVPVVPTENVYVDAKKIGIIIGPKGTTMQAIQEATGCRLEINAPSKDANQPLKPNAKAGVLISGPDKPSIQKARKAVTELATKGYATLLQSEDFGEFSIAVHPRFLSEIVGPGGRVIQALQKTLEVKITIPPTDWKPNAIVVGKVQPCKVGIAGSKDNSKKCKEAIKAITQYHHHEITHPGLTHEEVYVPQEFFHCVIGPRGSEIKHIRGNYKVDVYMPNAESTTENVIVVGKQTQVDKAISYIQLLMERDTEQREKKYSDEYYG